MTPRKKESVVLLKLALLARCAQPTVKDSTSHTRKSKSRKNTVRHWKEQPLPHTHLLTLEVASSSVGSAAPLLSSLSFA